MSKLNCPLLKSKAATRDSKNKLFQVATLLGLAFGLGASLSLQYSAIASLAHKETELVSIHEIADAISADENSAEVAAIESAKSGSVAAL